MNVDSLSTLSTGIFQSTSRRCSGEPVLSEKSRALCRIKRGSFVNMRARWSKAAASCFCRRAAYNLYVVLRREMGGLGFRVLGLGLGI